MSLTSSPWVSSVFESHLSGLVPNPGTLQIKQAQVASFSGISLLIGVSAEAWNVALQIDIRVLIPGRHEGDLTWKKGPCKCDYVKDPEKRFPGSRVDPNFKDRCPRKRQEREI